MIIFTLHNMFFLQYIKKVYFCCGEMAEWSIAAVLKTVEGNTSGGSNPSLSASNINQTAINHVFIAVFYFNTYIFTYN
jgi:hypothetical protein